MLETIVGIVSLVAGLVAIAEYIRRKKKTEEKPPQVPPVIVVQTPTAEPTSETKPPWNVPFRPNPNFIGREKEMDKLKDMLQQGTTAVISQVSQISGMGGVGKTQLAVEYAHKYRPEYPGGVLWVRGAEDVLSQYGLLSDELGLDLPMNMEESEKCHKVQQCLQQRQEQTLLILDNLDEKGAYESVHQCLPTTGKCQILITTRRKDLEAGKALPLDILLDDKALDLLITESGRDGEDKAAAQNICRSLGNLPLAIEAAGRYFKYSNKMISFQQYYAKLIEAGAIGVLPDKGKLPHVDHVASLKATLMVNKELMDNHQIRKMLSVIICFEPDSINPEILALVCGIEREKLDELISILDNYSLVNIQEDNRLSIHRLMREALREQISQKEIKARQREYVIQLQKWFREHNEVTALKISTPEIPHILGAARLATWPQSYDLCFDLETYYRFMGYYRECLKWAQKSEAEVKSKSPRDYERLGRSYNEIGVAWRCLGEDKKAIGYYKQALPLYKKHYGDRHPEVAALLNNLGEAWRNLGEYKKAIGYFEQALSIDKQFYGERHPDVAIRLNNLGEAWRNLGEYKKAIGYYEQALAIWKEAYGEKHPDVATCLNNLGAAWDDLGEYEKAIGYYEQALALGKEHFGERHPKIAIRLNNLGFAWKSLKQYDKAREYFQQAYSIFVEFLGEEHPHTKIAKKNLEGLPG